MEKTIWVFSNIVICIMNANAIVSRIGGMNTYNEITISNIEKKYMKYIKQYLKQQNLSYALNLAK